LSAAGEPRPRREPWIPAAWGLLAAEVALLVYIGSRTGGPNPVRAYLFGPTALMGAALALGVLGLWTSARRPPLLSGRRAAALAALGFVFVSSGLPYPFPAAREHHPSRVDFRLPVSGEWTAAWGGDDTQLNLLARSMPSRRYALCLVRAVDGRTRRTPDASRPEDYLAFGEPVDAPAAGRVVRAVGDLPDGPVERFGDELGNHVVLEVAPGELLFVTNLAQGSLLVAEGERVEAGAPLARVGGSARSRFLPEPHLGLHLQDSPDPVYGQGVPWYLHHVELDGEPVERAVPAGGGAREGRFGGQRVLRSAP